MPSSTSKLLDKHELAEELVKIGRFPTMTPGTIIRWVEREGLIPDAEGKGRVPHRFYIEHVLAWLDRKEEHRNRPGGPLDVTTERARAYRAQAELNEQKLALQRGELRPLSEIGPTIRAAFMAVRTHFLAMPTTQSARLHNAGERDGVAGLEREFKAVVHEALKEIASEDFGQRVVAAVEQEMADGDEPDPDKQVEGEQP